MSHGSVETKHYFILALHLVGAVVAVGSFLLGLWSVFSHPGQGFMLMGLGIVFGVLFGRVPRGAGETLADKRSRK
jgi:hypothetical protein